MDIIGKTFGRLKVVARVENVTGRKRKYLCLCVCGNTAKVIGGNLRNGNTSSCGCLFREITRSQSITHGKTRTKIYRTWCNMVSRCENSKNDHYYQYGGRGIKICDRWKTFKNFFDDMGDIPTGMEIDRIDNNGDYSPSNCRWITHIENCSNKRTSRTLDYNGESKTIAQWSRSIGIKQGTILKRLKSGWELSRILTEPLKVR